jgi:Rrf2 family cysteine metabolism transcriptional repressor
MRLSTRARYGARAALEIARNWGKGQTRRRDIAERQGISKAYLENILIALKSGGIVQTVRGASGGFALTRSPGGISLLDVFNALEGDLAPVECAVKPESCARSLACAMRPVYERLRKAQEGVLKAYTLQDLVDNAAQGARPDFCI